MTAWETRVRATAFMVADIGENSDVGFTFLHLMIFRANLMY